MALPRIDTPTYELTLPLSKKQIIFRPFLVKEQKILLMAGESGEKDSIVRALKQVLQNCTLSEVKIESLPLLDIEYYFLNIRARSVGEIVEMKYKCENEVDSIICGNNLDVSFNLLEIEVKNSENFNDTVMITDVIGIKFKHPDYSLFEKISENQNPADMALDIIVNSVDYIFEGDTFHYAAETPKEEIHEFLDSLSQNKFEMIEKIFENLPYLKKDVPIKCSKCGYEHLVKMEGLESFFV